MLQFRQTNNIKLYKTTILAIASLYSLFQLKLRDMNFQYYDVDHDGFEIIDYVLLVSLFLNNWFYLYVVLYFISSGKYYIY